MLKKNRLVVIPLEGTTLDGVAMAGARNTMAAFGTAGGVPHITDPSTGVGVVYAPGKNFAFVKAATVGLIGFPLKFRESVSPFEVSMVANHKTGVCKVKTSGESVGGNRTWGGVLRWAGSYSNGLTIASVRCRHGGTSVIGASGIHTQLYDQTYLNGTTTYCDTPGFGPHGGSVPKIYCAAIYQMPEATYLAKGGDPTHVVAGVAPVTRVLSQPTAASTNLTLTEYDKNGVVLSGAPTGTVVSSTLLGAARTFNIPLMHPMCFGPTGDKFLAMLTPAYHASPWNYVDIPWGTFNVAPVSAIFEFDLTAATAAAISPQAVLETYNLDVPAGYIVRTGLYSSVPGGGQTVQTWDRSGAIDTHSLQVLTSRNCATYVGGSVAYVETATYTDTVTHYNTGAYLRTMTTYDAFPVQYDEAITNNGAYTSTVRSRIVGKDYAGTTLFDENLDLAPVVFAMSHAATEGWHRSSAGVMTSTVSRVWNSTHTGGRYIQADCVFADAAAALYGFVVLRETFSASGALTGTTVDTPTITPISSGTTVTLTGTDTRARVCELWVYKAGVRVAQITLGTWNYYSASPTYTAVMPGNQADVYSWPNTDPASTVVTPTTVTSTAAATTSEALGNDVRPAGSCAVSPDGTEIAFSVYATNQYAIDNGIKPKASKMGKLNPDTGLWTFIDIPVVDPAADFYGGLHFR